MSDVDQEIAAFADQERGNPEHRRAARCEPRIAEGGRVGGRIFEALDRQRVQIDCHEHIVGGQEAPIQIENSRAV